ncbi:MAG: SDR family oxidoreductase [Actinobacteria bacterium]|nr:SDR family oxidoreductase [Actinomycetota bacterium]
MRIVLTGGAGFIGSNMCRTLLSRGHEVIVFDNLLTGSRRNIGNLLTEGGFTFVEHDVAEPFDVDGPVDRVMHLASPASPADFGRLSLEIMAVGSNGTRNGLELARAKGARFFLASTSEVYGDPALHPQPESYFGNVNPVGPRGVYDESKRFAEALTFAYHRRYGVDIRVARIFNCYGPQMRVDDGRAITNFLWQALSGKPLTIYGTGMQTRSFCFVDDEVEGLLALMECDHTGPMNIGSTFEHTLNDLAEIVLNVTGSDSPIEFMPLPQDDPAQRCPDLTLARSVLGWEPTVLLEEGVARTAAYFETLLDSQ